MGSFLSKLKSLFSGKQMEICLVGVENSGKSTLLSVLSLGAPVETMPTVGLSVKYVKKNDVSMKCIDLGGQSRFRSEWSRYCASADVIIFVVDSSDHERVPIAKKELHALLEDRNLNGKPLLLALNKIDLEPRYSKSEIVRLMNLDYLTDRPWIVLPLSAKYKMNIESVVEFLLKYSKAK